MKIKEGKVKVCMEEAVKVVQISVKEDLATTFRSLNLSSKTLWTKATPLLRSQVV